MDGLAGGLESLLSLTSARPRIQMASCECRTRAASARPYRGEYRAGSAPRGTEADDCLAAVHQLHLGALRVPLLHQAEGPGRRCSPCHRMPANSQETRIQSALDDVAGNVCQAYQALRPRTHRQRERAPSRPRRRSRSSNLMCTSSHSAPDTSRRAHATCRRHARRRHRHPLPWVLRCTRVGVVHARDPSGWPWPVGGPWPRGRGRHL
jgi:hypothetical protein